VFEENVDKEVGSGVIETGTTVVTEVELEGVLERMKPEAKS
jgi:hypothetical protein